MPVREKQPRRAGSGPARPVLWSRPAHTPGKSRVFAAVGMEGTGETDWPAEEDGFEPLVPPWKRAGVFPENGLFNTGHSSRRVHEGGPTGEFRIESLDDST